MIVLAEFLMFILSGVSLSFLNGDTFFRIGVDPVFWFFYLLNIPQFIVSHHWMGITLDALIVLLLVLFARNPQQHKLAAALFLLMLCFYVTLTGYLSHRNYQIGFVLVFIPFIFKRKTNRYFAYEAVRYFLLFFYFSSAIFKLTGNIGNKSTLSSFLTGQFTPYFLENNTGWRTDLNLYLIHHQNISYVLFLAGMLIELSAAAGFFTKKFDKYLALLLILFHAGNWILMDISIIGQIAFITLLFLSRHSHKASKQWGEQL